jgi:hypothetical protein
MCADKPNANCGNVTSRRAGNAVSPLRRQLYRFAHLLGGLPFRDVALDNNGGSSNGSVKWSPIRGYFQHRSSRTNFQISGLLVTGCV